MATTTVGTIQLVASIDSKNYKRGAREIEDSNKSIEKSGNSLTRLNDKLGRMAKTGLKVAVGGFVALAGTIATMTIRGGISRALNIEDAQAKLKGLGHDANSVKNIMNSALDSVRGTAYGLDSAATIAAGAVAAGVKPGKELTKYLKMTADAATIAGTSLDEMGPIMNRVQTQQRAYTMELNMLADRGIPIYQWLQKEMGVSASALRDMVAKGKVDSKTYFKVINDNIGGAALESGKTTRGAWANLLAAMSRVGERIVKGPIDRVRKGFGSLTKWIDENSDEIVKVVDDIVRTLKTMATTTMNVAKTVYDLRGVIIPLVAAYAGYRLAIIAINTVQAIQATYAALTATRYVMLNGALIAVRTSTIKATVAQAALNTVMKLNPMALVAGAAIGIVTAYVSLITQTDRTKSATDRLTASRNQLKTATDAARNAEQQMKDAQLNAESAALRVERAQRNYNEALRVYGRNSLEAREAANELKRAKLDDARASETAKNKINEYRDANKKLASERWNFIQANHQIGDSARNAAGGYQRMTKAVQEARKEARKSGTVGINKKEVNAVLGIGNRASGGPVSANKPYVVGENPDGTLNKTSELFMPRTAGRIFSAKDLQSALSGENKVSSNQEITINVSGTFATSKQEQRNVAELIAERLREAQNSRGINGVIA